MAIDGSKLLRIAAAAVVLSSSAASATPAAQTGTLQCVIASFPAEASDAIAAAYEAGGLAAADEHEISDAVWDKVLPCLDESGPDAQARAENFGLAVMLYHVMKAAEAMLATRHSISGEALETGWRALSSEELAALAAFDSPQASESSIIGATMKVVTAAGLPASEAAMKNRPRLGEDAVAYATFRAKLESLSGRY